MNANNNNNSNASGVFVDHIKQVLLTLPPVTKFALFAPTIVIIFDAITFALFNSYLLMINHWSYLDRDIIYNFQMQRLVLYPIAWQTLTGVFITTIWIFPEIYKAERKMGTLRLAWILLTLFTIIPGIIYVFTMQLLAAYAPEYDFNGAGYFGMAGWVVGLYMLNYLTETEDNGQRMIAGSIRVPNKVWPILVFVFFVFLAPGASFILNLSTAIIAYLYANEKVPKVFTPSEEIITQYEENAWLRPLTRSPHFVSADSSGVYLPIFNPPQFSSAVLTEASPSSNHTSTASGGNFPGTGVRLGS